MGERTLYPGESALELPREGFGSYSWWQDAIRAAEECRDRRIELWKRNVKAYQAELINKTDDDIQVNIDFYNTEQKKAQLFFRTPRIALTAKMPGLEDAVTVFEPVLNEKLGPHGVNFAAAMGECLFDGLCPAGLWGMKVGYEGVQDGDVDVPTGGMIPDPKFAPPPQPGNILNLQTPQTPMVPETQAVPKIIYERYFTDRISPAAIVVPADFHGSDYHKAAWLGFRFVEDLAVAKDKGWVPQNFGGSGDDKYRLVTDPKIETRGPIVVGIELWLRAARFDPKVKHPERFRQLVFIDGVNKAVLYRESPYQRFDPQTGRFLVGMRRNPIHMKALRYVSDSAYPPSDCTISRTQVDELSEARTQMRKQRKRSLPLRWIDKNRAAPEDIDRIKRGDVQSIIPTDGRGDEIIGEVARAEFPRENFNIVNVIQQDIDKEWALGSNQQGVTEDTVRSATELSLIQSNINTRQDYERNKVLEYAIEVAESVGALIQLFADQQEYIEIVGQNGEKRLQPWDKTHIAGEYVYDAKPNSAQRLDATQDKKDWLDWTNFTAKSPVVNQAEIIRSGAPRFGFDPQRVMKEPEPPPPPDANFSFRFGGSDLAIPEVRALLVQMNPKLAPILSGPPSPEAMQATLAQAAKGQPHGGTADKADVLSKHSGEETGQLQGPTSQSAVM